MTGNDFCAAVSQKGRLVTVYAAGRAATVIPRRDGDFICTQDPGHKQGHASCDGHGHILARWPRSSVERYWRSGDCEGHDHGEHSEKGRRTDDE